MSADSVPVPPTMRAVVYDRYGGPEELRLERIPVPRPGPGEVLVQVVATGINLSDWECLHGSPAYARAGHGLRRPTRRVLGSDIAGRVVDVGPDVDRYRVGDAVYGDILQRMGGFAEYAVAPQEEVALKPPPLGFAEASAVPQPGAIAMQAVARGKVGERMLVNGAGGGSGSLTVQLAVAAGMRVTAVDNASKLEFLRSLGAHEVIDYRTSDFTRTGPYDLVIDFVAHRSVFAYRRALAPRGRYFMVGGTTRTILRLLTAGTLVGGLTRRRLGVLVVRPGPAHFVPLADRVGAGDVAIHIDSRFPLERVPEALVHHGEGRALGKVVVDVAGQLGAPGGAAGVA